MPSYHRPVSAARAAIDRLARRSGLTEADIQSDVRLVLLTGGLNLDADDLIEPRLEVQAGQGRRIDVEIGTTVIEVKKDLRNPRVRVRAIEQLAGYVAHRTAQLGVRYVGILTDGSEWTLFHLAADSQSLREVSRYDLTPTSADLSHFSNWLEGVLATAEGVVPLPKEIAGRLGADSSAHALDFADLSALYEAHRELPTVKLKRELWARLLTTAFGTNFRNDDELFVEHTLLVVTAELIAHAVVGIDPRDHAIGVDELLAGRRFSDAQIGGVVEADFFDWVTEVPGGDLFVRALARRLQRFAWDRVEHDVMKVLYESVIAAEQRKKLGEYYTPDWLAHQVVEQVVDDPLTQRVLDPSCGSGTFVFHAVRHVLGAADEEGLGNTEAIELATRLVAGVDIHPVAVTLARVTYLLAIGWDRLNDPERPAFNVPVYLGDSLQWRQQETLFDTDDLVVSTDDGAALFDSELRFPRALLANAGEFDRLVTEFASRASGAPGARTERALNGVLNRFRIAEEHRQTLIETFNVMRHLHDHERDHIWGYYVRNLARPAWLTRPENRVDRLVGNPPWLAYRFMTKKMQGEFSAMSRDRQLWSRDGSVATHQDLSALFVVRAAELYLRHGGRFGFVMPNAVLTRRQYEGFRAGRYMGSGEPVSIAFSEPWDLEPIRPIFFPQSSCVVFGTRASTASPLPTSAVQWNGRLPRANPSWDEARPKLTRSPIAAAKAHIADGTPSSPYAPGVWQGATFVPRMLIVVETPEDDGSRLGLGTGRVAVRSRRSPNEKAPWKTLQPLTGSVETRFVFRMHLGETLLPFRLADPLRVVLPIEGSTLLDEDGDRLALSPGLEDWWSRASSTWREHHKGDLTLAQQVDFRQKLTEQLDPAPVRLVHAASGIHLVAALVTDARVLIDKSLYWTSCSSVEEGRYLEALLNADAVDELLKPLQSRGKDSPRHIDKYVWELPIPRYDPTVELHLRLAALAERAAREASEVVLLENDFRRRRNEIRTELRLSGVATELDAAARELFAGFGEPS